jgi:DNA polymerase III alpha subunit
MRISFAPVISWILIRTDLKIIGKREIESLIDSGAFDSFGTDYRE